MAMKSCALLLFFASPATGMAVGRSNSGAAAMTQDGPSPWLSLLTKSWALPGESQEEQSKGLDALADNIVQLAKSQKSGQAADPSMQAALDSIKQILKDMMDAVTAANKAAQTEIFKKQAAVAACPAPNATDKATFEASLHVKGSDVVTCRAAEKEYYDRWEHCKAEDARCSNTTECCAQVIQPSQYCLSQPVAPTPLTLQSSCNGVPKCVEQDLRSKLGFFEAKLKEYNDAEAACELSRAGCNSSYACADFKAQWQQFHGLCNSNQTSFEQAYCDLATHLEASWETYTLCHTHASQALATEEGKQETLLAGRRQEWRGLLRIECLLEALSAADKESALQNCITKNVTSEATTTLNLTFPTHAGNVTELAHCAEKLEAPGTASFVRSHYSAVPSVLMPDSLNTFYCVSGIATSHCPIATGAASLLAKGHYVPHARWGLPAHA